jgi:hypothetical protein
MRVWRRDDVTEGTGQPQIDTGVELYSPQRMSSLGDSVHVLLYWLLW